jgi:hypothetical protein
LRFGKCAFLYALRPAAHGRWILSLKDIFMTKINMTSDIHAPVAAPKTIELEKVAEPAKVVTMPVTPSAPAVTPGK